MIKKKTIKEVSIKQYWGDVSFLWHTPLTHTVPDMRGMDVLLAHVIIFPILKKYESSLKLWRFHRRRADDSTGQKMSFYFYTDESTINKIYGEVRSHDLRDLPGLDFQFDYLSKDYKTLNKIEDLNDPEWSNTVQEVWPEFMMAVSKMWIQMIDKSTSSEYSLQPDTIKKNLLNYVAYYSRVDDWVMNIYRHKGPHFLLHHIGCLFGHDFYPHARYYDRADKRSE